MTIELSKQSIADWLVAELNYKHDVPVDIGKQLLESHQLLPLLDGLDELKATRQGRCIEKINQFLQVENRLPQLVVCSRLEEYNFCKTQMEQLNGAVCLQPLTEEQIWEYLTCLKRPKLWQSIQGDYVLKELAASPFLLTIMVVAYKETTIQQANNCDPEGSRQVYLKCLFDAYIQKKLNDPLKSKSYPAKKPDAEETIRWLKFLAKQLKRESEKEFFIEKMQPSWLETTTQKWLYRVGIVLIGLLIGRWIWVLISVLIALSMQLIMLNWVLIGMSLLLVLGLSGILRPIGLRYSVSKLIRWWFSKSDYLSFSLTHSKHFARRDYKVMEIYLPTWEIVWRGIENIVNSIKPAENFHFFWTKKTREKLIMRMTSGLIPGFILGLILGLFLGLISGLFGMLIWVLILEMMSAEIQARAKPNQGIWNSAKIFVILTMITCVICTLFLRLLSQSQGLNFELSYLLTAALLVGLSFGICFSAYPIIQHFVLRLILWQSGFVPWNYARFLDYACERKFLQRVGGRYRFIHDFLREHFAQI